MDKYQSIITKSSQETANLGEGIGRKQPRLVCLYGELGSGKTTFVQGFAKGLGLTQARLLSPTFIIVRRYDIPAAGKFFYHIDLYRVKDASGIKGLGLEEIFSDPNAYVVIEWAERLGGLLPKDRIDIQFLTIEDEKHTISIR